MSAPGRPKSEYRGAQHEGTRTSAPSQPSGAHHDARGTGGGPVSGRSSAVQTALAVFWSFFGVRKRADYESDVQRLNPRHVLVAGLVGAALFVLTLVLLVRWVVASGVAAG